MIQTETPQHGHSGYWNDLHRNLNQMSLDLGLISWRAAINGQKLFTLGDFSFRIDTEVSTYGQKSLVLHHPMAIFSYFNQNVQENPSRTNLEVLRFNLRGNEIHEVKCKLAETNDSITIRPDGYSIEKKSTGERNCSAVEWKVDKIGGNTALLKEFTLNGIVYTEGTCKNGDIVYSNSNGSLSFFPIDSRSLTSEVVDTRDLVLPEPGINNIQHHLNYILKDFIAGDVLRRLGCI